MKKIINKLFEKLGYVPKGRLVALECLRSSIARTSSLVHTAIKCFPYGEDKSYAKLCAEELYELLKQD